MWTHLQMNGFGYFCHTRCWQVYTIEQTAMQSPETNIGTRMARTKELSDFHPGSVKRYHLSNKSVCQIYAMLELPRSTVSAVIVKWKHLGATTAQLQSGRLHKLTKRDRHVKIICPCNTHYQVPNCFWKQCQHKNCSSGSSWNGFPWLSSRIQA